MYNNILPNYGMNFTTNNSTANAFNNSTFSGYFQTNPLDISNMDFMSMFIQQSIMIMNLGKYNNLQKGCGTYCVDHRKLESKYSPTIEKYAEKYGVRADVAKAIARQESGFNPNAVSNAGAKGMFQLMDGTAHDMNVKDVFNPEQNIEGGVKYLAFLVKRYNGDYRKAVAAYNGGMGNIDKKGIDFCAETRNYHRAILGNC